MKAFGLSALLSLILSSLWILALWYAGKHDEDGMLAAVLGSYAAVVAISTFASAWLFKGQRWQAACGALAVSATFVSAVAAIVAWQHAA